MIYTESASFGRWGPPLLFAIVAIVYVLPMALLPVRGSEARMAFLANQSAPSPASERGIFAGKSPYALLTRAGYVLATSLSGRPAADAPFPAWDEAAELPALSPLAATWAVRLPLLLALVLLIVPCAHVVASEMGKVEGYLTAGMALTCWPLIVVANVDRRVVLLAGLLNAAWFMWYHYGRCHKNWDMAWASAAIFLFLACLEGGLLMLVVYYFPLVFLRRPFRIWQRMLNPVHLTTLTAILVVGVFWAHFSHADAVFEAIRRSYGTGQVASFSLFARLLLFPLVFIAYYFPWPCLTWPAYCVAYRPLEQSSSLAHFLRTLTVPLFVAAWLLPGFPKLLTVSLIPPLACLTAMHYRLLVRRHILPLRRLSRFLRRAAACACLVVLALYALHATEMLYFDGVKPMTVAVAVGLCTLTLLPLVLARRWKHGGGHFWVEIMLLTCAAAMLAISLALPTVDFLRRDKAVEAAGLVAQVPEAEPIFLLQRGGVAATAFHTRRRLIPVSTPNDIPADLPIVYVWGGARPPLLVMRKWERVSESFATHRPRIVALVRRVDRRLGWRVETSVVENEPGQDDVMCMYRGTLDPASL